MSIRLLSPYLPRGFQWLRGNLHAHTTRSDGSASPEEVIARYEQLGYDFLAISDHDLLVPPEEFQALTRMTLIPADEVSCNGPHILAVQIRAVITPDADRQQVLAETAAQSGFTVLNHPNWLHHYNHFPQELMEQLEGYAGIEIYNALIERLEGSALATDRWDRLLSGGRRVWGYAHDDSHAPTDIGRGWNVVQAADRSVEALCEALRQGRFYASSGVEIAQIEVGERTISVAAPNAQRIRFIGAYSRGVYDVDADHATYEVTGEEGGYVRVECYGAGGRTAWTQPFFLSEEEAQP
ncbi:MAG TPA: CehA/McbA family metallohydrolase [Chthonomonadaceae bacterium]|nr:CehA/McbA family metallohydrolase [Chthonomonadaceae bacterium]